MAPSEDQLKTDEDISASGDALEDVPVNKITTFHGRLQHFLHRSSESQGRASAPSTAIAQERTSIKTEETEPTSKRKKTTLQTASESTISQSTTAPSPKRKRTTPSPQIHPTAPGPSAAESLLVDTIPPNLVLLLVGVNPGIMTGITGYAYAHPSNLFWKLLHSSGITSTRHKPADTYKLPALYSVGNTNIVERPTRDASMLRRAEMDAGVPILEAKIAAQRPEVVGLVGKSIWEAVWRVRKGRGIRKEEFRYGWQEEKMGITDEWEGAKVFVTTTTSGLAAGMKPAEKEAVWAELGDWVVRRRRERGFVPGNLEGNILVKDEEV
jgi:TDG/mug DNA glycosylase family protein